MRARTILIAAMAALPCLAIGTAQAEVAQDAELWMELGVRYQPVKRLRLSLDQHLRLEDSMSSPQSLMSEFGVRYRPLRWLSVGGGYRLAHVQTDNGIFRRRHRLHVEAATRHNLGPVRLGFRLRFQEEARMSDGSDGDPWRHVLRGRASLQLRRLPVDPFLSFEVFLRFANDDVAAEVRKLRGTLGVEIETDAGDLDICYRAELGLDALDVVHIVLLGWHFDAGPRGHHPARPRNRATTSDASDGSSSISESQR